MADTKLLKEHAVIEMEQHNKGTRNKKQEALP